MNIKGLFHAIDSSSKNLQIMSSALMSTTNNIANANSADYIKSTLTTEANIINGDVAGSRILSMFPSIDKFNLSNLQSQLSDVSSLKEVNQYLEQIDIYLGDPNNEESSNISAMLNELFTSISALASDSSADSLAHNAVLKADQLANSVSDLANKIQQLRLDADTEIANTINTINTTIDTLKTLNDQMLIVSNDPVSSANTQSLIIQNQKKLNNLIKVEYKHDQNGILHISTDQGVKLLGLEKHFLEYDNAQSLSVFTQDMPLNPTKSFVTNSFGEKGVAEDLISGGQSNNIKPNFSGGKLHGLQQARDVILPQLLDKIDNFAKQLVYSFNKIQNSGAGSRFKQEYVGETITNRNEIRDWQGSTRISVVNKDGNPISLDEQNILRPLEINFDKLNVGYGNGKKIPTQSIIDEINDHFISSLSKPKVKIGGDGGDRDAIENIRLVSSKTITSSANEFSFDFELENAGADGYNFEILELDVDNGASITMHNQNEYNIGAGKKDRTSQNHQILFSNTANEFNIAARVKVTNEKTGEIFVSDITYKVNKDDVAVNNKFSASSASGDNTISGTKGAEFVSTNLYSDVLSAEIIDADTNHVTENDGYLQIRTTNKEYYLIIDDILPESQEEPISNLLSNQAQTKGFSHYFGMNNLFSTEKNDNIKGAALSMKVKQDIIDSEGQFLSKSTAKLNMSDKIIASNIGKVASTGSLQLDNIPDIGDSVTFGNDTYVFANDMTQNNIDISSGDLSVITDNIITKLNQEKLQLANYTKDSSNKINIQYNFKGDIGNNFLVSHNFNTATASINGAVSNNIGSANLVGGENTKVAESVPQWGYSIAESDKSVLESFLQLQSEKILFDSSTGQKSTSLSNYINNDIFGHARNIMTVMQSELLNEEAILGKYEQKFNSQTAVSIDEEFSNMLKFNQTYTASAKFIASANKLFDSLLSII